MVYICPIISGNAIDGCMCKWMDGLMDMTDDGCRQDDYGFAFTIQNLRLTWSWRHLQNIADSTGQ